MKGILIKKKEEWTKYVPINDKESNFLRVSAYYSLGGLNYFTYKEEPRGYWLSLQPVKREESGGCVCESFVGFSGVKKFIQPANRFSSKVAETAFSNALEDPFIEEWMSSKGLTVKEVTE